MGTNKQYHRIPVKPETAEQINDQRKVGETWDDAVQKLLDDT